MDSKLGHNLSLTWQKIKSSLDLIKEYMLWPIGNGWLVKIWGTKWLPTPSTIRIKISVNMLDSIALVESLIDPNIKLWNRQLIFQVFTSEKAKVIICKIPLSLYGANDKILWWPTRNGFFSVKSTYFLKMNRNKMYEGESSKTNIDKGI